MSILSDSDIKLWINEKGIAIEPFNEKNLTPNGYDLTIDEILIPKLKKHAKEGIVKIPYLTWFVISTKEYIKLTAKVCGQLWIRSSWARKGVICSFGKVDSGFEGTLTFSAFNASIKELDMPIGVRFAQIIFETLASKPEFLYGQKQSSYQGQRGIHL